MSYTVVFSVQAIETFDAVKNQIQSKWGNKAVNNFEKRVVEVIDLIAISPFLYQTVEQLVQVRKALIHKNCTMFYEVSDEIINVLFFWDNRQNPVF